MEGGDGPTRTRRVLQALLLAGMAGALYLVSRSNYLLFHSLVEVFSVVVALSVFVIAWHSRRYLENAFLLVVGTAYLFMGLLDLLHLLAFPGMSVFAEPAYQSTQLWVAGRYLDGLTLVAAFAFLPVRRQPNRFALVAIYAGVTALILASIFLWKTFPVCFVPGAGLTTFKIASEYVVLALLAIALALLYAHRRAFEPGVLCAVAASILFAMAAGFSFTLYVSPTGPSNLLGHFFKLFSYVAIYVALVETCVEAPYAIVFRELAVANARLSEEVATRKEIARAKDRAIDELRFALEEIRTLRGIIPICAHCKQIRDDRGAWNQIEAYIQLHSEAQFSHGICPDCARRYFPELDP